MAAARAWVLNLDAEYELADPRGYTPSQAALERIRSQAARVHGLLQPADVVVDGQTRLTGDFAGEAWCPTPRALAMLEAAGARLPQHPPLAVLQRVNHRRFAAELPSGALDSRYVETPEAAHALLARRSPSGRWVAKRAFGLAGRGQRRFSAAPDELDSRWIRSSFKQGHGLLVEPWVERDADFVNHGLLAHDGVVTVGRPLLQHCDLHGMWQRTLLLPAGALEEAELEALRQSVLSAGQALHQAGYFGPFGIDAYRYRDPHRTRRFNPRVEINARHCMGWALSGL